MNIAAVRMEMPTIAMKSEIARTRPASPNRAMSEEPRGAAGGAAWMRDCAPRRNTIGASRATKEETTQNAAPNFPIGAAMWSHGLEVGWGGLAGESNAHPLLQFGTYPFRHSSQP